MRGRVWRMDEMQLGVVGRDPWSQEGLARMGTEQNSHAAVGGTGKISIGKEDLPSERKKRCLRFQARVLAWPNLWSVGAR